jgi:hypothetical protein
MVRQPGKYAGIAKTLRMASGETQAKKGEFKELPEYMQRSFPLRMGEDAGMVNYLYGLGLPLEDLSNLNVSGVLAKMSPILKVPLELATNKNFYFNQPITDFDSAPDLIQKAPKFVKDLLDYEVTDVGGKKYPTLNPIKWHILSNIFGRAFYTADKLGDSEVQTGVKMLYSVLGIKGKAIDVEKQKYYKRKGQAEQLGEWLFKKGAVRQYKTYYTPKE